MSFLRYLVISTSPPLVVGSGPFPRSLRRVKRGFAQALAGEEIPFSSMVSRVVVVRYSSSLGGHSTCFQIFSSSNSTLFEDAFHCARLNLMMMGYYASLSCFFIPPYFMTTAC